MIYDVLDSDRTRWLARHNAALEEAFEWLKAMPSDVPEGLVQLAGCGAVVSVHGYNTKPAEQCRWESHRHTADLQYCIAGGEVIEWLAEGALPPLDDYDSAKDTEHWAPAVIAATHLRMAPRTFAIFLPGELHRPKIADGLSPAVKKLVVKLDASLLRS